MLLAATAPTKARRIIFTSLVAKRESTIVMMSRFVDKLRACVQLGVPPARSISLWVDSERTKKQARYFSSCLPRGDTFHDVIVCAGQRRHSNIWSSHLPDRERNRRAWRSVRGKHIHFRGKKKGVEDEGRWK